MFEASTFPRSCFVAIGLLESALVPAGGHVPVMRALMDDN